MTEAEEIEFPDALASRYAPVRRLGAGGIGMVYEAMDRAIERPVAVKFLLHPEDEHLIERFRREAEALGRVEHPGILDVFDFGVLPTGPYLVMELLTGTPLDKLETPPDLHELAFQLASALDAIHADGIIHRDVKPENVMIEPGDRAVLVDFGLMLDPDQSRLTATGGLVGSLAYTGPEIMGGADPTPATDWYALGISLFQLVEGQPPFRFPVVIAASQTKELPEPRFEKIDPGSKLAALIRRLLDADPEKRLAGSRAVREILGAEGGEEPAAPAPGDAEPPAPVEDPSPLQKAAVPLVLLVSFLLTMLLANCAG